MSDEFALTRFVGATASPTKRVSADATLRVFDFEVTPHAVFETWEVDGKVKKRLVFSVLAGDRTLGDVLRYILDLAGGNSNLDLGEPWNVIDSISLKGLAFQFETSTDGQRYGFSYSDIGLDLTFLQIDKLEIWYRPAKTGPPRVASSVDVNVYGTFLGVPFTKDPISWDALREQPPATPAAGGQKFRLDYLGLGQHVTLRNVRELDTIAKVMDALAGSYKKLKGDVVDPLDELGDLTYDDGAAWLIGTKFSAMETFELAAIWNLPALAGLRVALSGERAKSLAGLEFEILYRRIADDLGVYHIELVLPDVLRKFQAGVASVTLPVIVVDVYTDGGFLVDLGFPHALDFSRSAQLEIIIMGVPVLGSLGVYFGVLSPKAVPALPRIAGGNFGPVIVAGVGARIGVGKSLQAGLLSGEVFIGIEGTLEGIVAFYEPEHPEDPKGTFYRVDGTLQLTGHIWGQVSFAIIKAKLDIYAYVSARAVLEAYRLTVVVFSAGVSLKLTVTVGIGWFSFDVKLAFSASISEQITVGNDTTAPWRLAGPESATLTERLTRGAYRRLPTGAVHADATYARLLAAPAMPRRPSRPRGESADPASITLYFHPIASVGVRGDRPAGRAPRSLDAGDGEVTLVASLVTSLTRPDAGGLSSGEAFVRCALLWGIEEIREGLSRQDGAVEPEYVTLSELHFLADDLASTDPKFPIRKADVIGFFKNGWVELDFVPLTQETPCFDATPFPMVPFYVLTATAKGVEQHRADLAADPLCSVAYQAFVSHYFDELYQGNDDHREAEDARRRTEGEDLSMAWLVFMDSFRMVLKAIVCSAIDTLTLYRVTATGDQSLLDITAACGLPPEALRDVAEANVANDALWQAGTTVRLVEQGVVTGEVDDLDGLAGAFDVPLLDTARHVRAQPILRIGSTIRVVGGRYRLMPDDTPDSIADALRPLEWPAIQAANPFFDWSVPKPAAGYKTLVVPAGSTIDLPTVAHVVIDELETLQSIADRYGAPLYGLLHHPDPRNPAAEDSGILLQTGCTAWRCITFYVVEAESLSALQRRIGLEAGAVGQRALLGAVATDSSLLLVGATIAIRGGTYVIARGDDLDGIARTLQTTPEAIENANAAEPQVLIPRPFSEASLPMGETLVIPDVEYVVQTGDSFASIAHAFSVDAFQLFTDQAVQEDAGLLRTLAAVIAPPIPVVIASPDGEAAPTPEALATPYGVRPVELVLANQRSPSGQGADISFGVVAVPQCERVPTADLMALLATKAADGPSAFGAALQGLARFLLAGLRLPDPARVPTAPSPDDPLYPLYTLTGQQWPAPPERMDDYVIALTPAPDVDSQRWSRTLVSAATLEDGSGLTTTLDIGDWDLIDAFRAVLADRNPILKPLISAIAYPALQQVPREMALGVPIEWSVPVPPSFAGSPTAGDGPGAGESIVLLLPLPEPLRHRLPTDSADRDVGLVVQEALPDPNTGQARWRTLVDVGFAVRLEIKVRRAYESGSDDVAIPAVYELVSAAAQTQAELTGLLQYLRATAGTVVPEIHILFAPSATSHLAESLQSDALSAEDRRRVAIFKSNLSTFSRPSRTLATPDAGEPAVTAASLDAPIPFVQLLWELSVTNSGGFYLDYGAPAADPGLPDDVFAESETTELTFLVIVRVRDGQASIAPRAFHDTLICAQNLSAPSANVVVTPVRYAVGEGTEPGTTQSLDAVASAVGLTTTVVAELNRSTPNVLQAGFPVPRGDGEEPYLVRPGDDLLTVAATLDVKVADVATRIAAAEGALHLGALLEVEPDWVVPRNRVAQLLGGFRVLRTIPPPVAGDRRAPYNPEDGIDSLDARARLERMFNLLSYGLEQTPAFERSTRGLPVAPADPDATQPNGLFAVAAGEEQPWLYDRLMPVAAWAKQPMGLGPDSVDPYARLGESATIALRFHDVFGNLLPGPGAPAAVAWSQAYRDPIQPPTLWPSVTVAYDVRQVVTHDTPELDVRIKFAPAGYVVEPGMTVERLRRRARCDRADFATAFYQTADDRLAATLRCTLVPEEQRQVSMTALNGFARNCHEYLRVIERLRPLWHEVGDARDLGRIADAYRVTPGELARTAAGADDVLDPRALYEIPVFQLVLPNMTIRAIIEAFEAATGHTLTAGEIAKQNPSARLTAGIDVLVGDDQTWEVGHRATLQSVASENGLSVETLADLNQTLKRFFHQGDVLLLATQTAPVQGTETLADLARAANLTIDEFANWNADAPILRQGAQLEIPRHVIVPEAAESEAPGIVVRVRHDESIAALTERVGLETAIRDVATANADVVGFLELDAVVVYPRKDGKLEPVTVREEDTLSTVTALLARTLDLPDLKPADVCSWPENAWNSGLLREDALALVPSRRLVVPWNLVLDERLEAGIVELRVTLEMVRTDTAAIDPQFTDAPGVGTVTIEVPPRLSSAHTREERESLRAFAKQFNAVFPNLFLATGPAVLQSGALGAGAAAKTDPTKLLAVQWQEGWRDFEIHQAPVFFAPTPLITEWWHEQDVVIYEYRSGEPLPPNPLPVPPPVQDFTNVDLERWAEVFLGRVDTLLEPRMGSALRALDPAQFDRLTQAKAVIAGAIAGRVEEVLDRVPSIMPDQPQAQKTFEQQLLVALLPAYRGGTVLQFPATVYAPTDWVKGSAPAVYGHAQLIPALELPCEPTEATLDWIADQFEVPSILVAEVLQTEPNILDTGSTITLPGKTPVTIGKQDTLLSLCEELDAKLSALVDVYEDKPGLLKPGAPIGIVVKQHSAVADDTFLTVVDQLAADVVSNQDLRTAIRRFALVNERLAGVFLAGIDLSYQGRPYRTTGREDLVTAAGALGMTSADFVYEFRARFPLLLEHVIPLPGAEPKPLTAPPFRFLTLYPPSTLSDAKLELYAAAGSEPPSSLNVMYVTSSPDDAGSVKLRLGFESTEMEYRRRAPFADLDYKSSEWLTFIGSRRRSDLGDVEIPIVNRRFPIPPAILSHDTVPVVREDWTQQPTTEDLLRYGYALSFAFHPAAQDEVAFEAEYYETPVIGSGVSTAMEQRVGVAPDSLATQLAQFQAIEKTLWADLLALRTRTEDAGPDPVLSNAIEVFVGLAERIGSMWGDWTAPREARPERQRYRIRTHGRRGEAPGVTMCPVGHAPTGRVNGGRPAPRARLLGPRVAATGARNGVTWTSHVLAGPAPQPLEDPYRYEVFQPGLNVLKEQSAIGLISVTRNGNLISGVATNDPFVLHIRDVQPDHVAVPRLLQTRELVIGTLTGLSLSKRIARFLIELLFPDGPGGVQRAQLVSMGMAYARPIFENTMEPAAGSPVPADTRTLFVPIAITPAQSLALLDAGLTQPEVLAQAISARLEEWTPDLPATVHWSLTLRLFGTDPSLESQTPLLELVDLRIPNATQ